MVTIPATYGILTITDVRNLVQFNIQQTLADGTTRMYTDDEITKLISQAERLVFGKIHKTYTLATIPIDVYSAIEMVAKVMMNNQLIGDEYKTGPVFDPLDYYERFVKDMIATEEAANDYEEAWDVDDWEDY